jgi:cell division protein FtsL
MKIARVLNVVAVCGLVGAAATVYRISYQATWQAEEVARLERQIERERSSIAVLEAEWAHLTRPDRIQILAAKNLPLKAADPRQRAGLGDLPMRPARVDSIAETLASLGIEQPLAAEPKAEQGDDLIGRTIEAMGLALPDGQDRVGRTMNALGLGDAPPPPPWMPR